MLATPVIVILVPLWTAVTIDPKFEVINAVMLAALVVAFKTVGVMVSEASTPFTLTVITSETAAVAVKDTNSCRLVD